MTEGRGTRRGLAPVVTTVLISGVITASGVLLYVFTNQTVASYAVGVALPYVAARSLKACDVRTTVADAR
jgi:hypothetical protein